jgi:predicted deacylase
MSDLRYFPEDYTDARKRFHEAAENLTQADGAFSMESFQVPSRRDQGLFVDYLLMPAKRTPETLLVLVSGVHGMEAFTGSALQQMFLRELLGDVPRDRVGVLIVHCLNPFGFKYLRRSTENNVNLNRNFGPTPESFRIPNPGYQRLADLLTPRAPAPQPVLAYASMLKFVATAMGPRKFSGAELNQSLAQGQFEYPHGLEFGGKTWEPQTAHFIQFLKDAAKPYRNLVMFDLHTGLGDRYQLHLIPVELPESRDPELVGRLFDIESEKHLYAYTTSDAKGFYRTHGDLNSLPPSLVTGEQKTLTLTFEFGTLGNGPLAKLQTLTRILLENQGFHQGYVSEKAKRQAQDEYRELFFPSEAKWRTNAVERTRETLHRVLGRI